MTLLPDFIQQVEQPVYTYQYSVCTLVTRKQEYLEMLNSFIEAGFTTDICEYLVVDNSETNKMDAYQGINSFLQKAGGKYIILCHQDILLTKTSTKLLLDEQIAAMDARDANWGVLGNAGAVDRLYKRNVYKIAYPQNKIDVKGNLPQKVCSVDENFIVVKKSANVGLSTDVGGFHLYGLDICMSAGLLGYTCYVIDFLLMHKSLGNVDDNFRSTLSYLKNKYSAFVKNRYLNTTNASFYLSGSVVKRMLFETRLFRRVIKTAEELKSKLST
ncbi:hypothetical protein [Mucilaginibacter dorajii]|uniref:Acyl esterase n=1 Tax=Mucilaginibacter dorajii TaxID=692994 RepID=A0ABP7Q6I3_9SPHI|nr:hypothetical protein [Mucilaginibacter dorajii]MCS3737838.1 hypothetical protein [Mucilaginibacter dorajii]